MIRGLAIAALLAMMLCLSGCSSFSGAASMTIDVDVYKGPLSQHYHMQRGELRGLVQEFALAACVYADNLVAIAQELDNIEAATDTPNCFDDFGNNNTSFDFTCKRGRGLNPLRTCKIVQQIVREAFDIQEMAQRVAKKFPSEADEDSDDGRTLSISRGQLSAVGALSIRAKSRAIYWAEHLVTSGNQPRAVRIAIVTFANLMGEYGNQIGATTDALAKRNSMYDIVEQYLIDNWCIDKDRDKNGKEESASGADRGGQKKITDDCDYLTKHEAAFRSGELLPPSVFLRESKPTAFINLYSWNRAGTIEPWENTLQHPIDAFTPESTVDRVRGTEQVFEDRYWSRINSVYASGRGEVNMAFVRSGEGNWGLKSFSNDPGQLLSSYTTLFTSTVKSVAGTLASGALPDAGVMQQLKSMVGGSMVATPGESLAPEDVDALHALMMQKLLLFKQEAEQLEKKQGSPEERAALLSKIERSLVTEADTLSRMNRRLAESRSVTAAGEEP